MKIISQKQKIIILINLYIQKLSKEEKLIQALYKIAFKFSEIATSTKYYLQTGAYLEGAIPT